MCDGRDQCDTRKGQDEAAQRGDRAGVLQPRRTIPTGGATAEHAAQADEADDANLQLLPLTSGIPYRKEVVLTGVNGILLRRGATPAWWSRPTV
jgi:hypothetical protein